jgi:hypothetical protein
LLNNGRDQHDNDEEFMLMPKGDDAGQRLRIDVADNNVLIVSGRYNDDHTRIDVVPPGGGYRKSATLEAETGVLPSHVNPRNWQGGIPRQVAA